MPTDELDELLDGLMDNAKSTGAENFAKKMVQLKEKRCFTYTSKFFICCECGGMTRSETAMSTLKGSGTLKQDMRFWSLAELFEKHMEHDVDAYVANVEERLEKAILNECYIASYVTDLEDEEAKHVENLYVVSAIPNTTNPFEPYLVDADEKAKQQANAIGTLYIIRPKESSDHETDARKVFVPDSKSYYCQSNFYMHTSYWIRCRFIQRALIDSRH